MSQNKYFNRPYPVYGKSQSFGILDTTIISKERTEYWKFFTFSCNIYDNFIKTSIFIEFIYFNRKIKNYKLV